MYKIILIGLLCTFAYSLPIDELSPKIRVIRSPSPAPEPTFLKNKHHQNNGYYGGDWWTGLETIGTILLTPTGNNWGGNWGNWGNSWGNWGNNGGNRWGGHGGHGGHGGRGGKFGQSQSQSIGFGPISFSQSQNQNGLFH